MSVSLARKPLLIIQDSATIQKLPGFDEWLAEAIKRFDIEFRVPGTAVLTIGSKLMQFRGDWTAWWLQPEKLAAFKPWNKGGPTGCSDADTPPDKE